MMMVSSSYSYQQQTVKTRLSVDKADPNTTLGSRGAYPHPSRSDGACTNVIHLHLLLDQLTIDIKEIHPPPPPSLTFL